MPADPQHSEFHQKIAIYSETHPLRLARYCGAACSQSITETAGKLALSAEETQCHILVAHRTDLSKVKLPPFFSLQNNKKSCHTDIFSSLAIGKNANVMFGIY